MHSGGFHPNNNPNRPPQGNMPHRGQRPHGNPSSNAPFHSRPPGNQGMGRAGNMPRQPDRPFHQQSQRPRSQMPPNNRAPIFSSPPPMQPPGPHPQFGGRPQQPPSFDGPNEQISRRPHRHFPPNQNPDFPPPEERSSLPIFPKQPIFPAPPIFPTHHHETIPYAQHQAQQQQLHHHQQQHQHQHQHQHHQIPQQHQHQQSFISGIIPNSIPEPVQMPRGQTPLLDVGPPGPLIRAGPASNIPIFPSQSYLIPPPMPGPLPQSQIQAQQQQQQQHFMNQQPRQDAPSNIYQQHQSQQPLQQQSSVPLMSQQTQQSVQVQQQTPETTQGNAIRIPNSVWVEQTTSDGLKCYYNTVDGSFSWDKPDEIKTPEEKLLPKCVWKEFLAEGGKKYYYNSTTQESVWEMPEEYKQHLFQVSQLSSKSITSSVPKSSSSSVSLPAKNQSAEPTNEKKDQPKKLIRIPAKVKEVKVYETKEEKVEAFKQLLVDKDIKADSTWDTSLKLIMNDERYEILKISEKKHIFNEYITQLGKEEKEEKRLKERKSRESFMFMLQERTDIDHDMPVRKVVSLVESDRRFNAVASEKDREELIRDHLAELERLEKERNKKRKDEAKAEFRKLLERTPAITSKTSWKKAQELLEDENEYAELKDRSERLEIFDDYIKVLERKEDEARAKEKERQKLEEKAVRDSLIDLLENMKQEGSLHAKSEASKTYDVIKANTDIQAHKLVKPSAREIIEERIEILHSKYLSTRNDMIHAIKESGYQMTRETTTEDLVSIISSSGKLPDVLQSEIKILRDELLQRIHEREKIEERRSEIVCEKFKLYLEKKDIRLNTTWETFKPRIERTAIYKAVDSESMSKQIFESHMAHLNKLKEKGCLEESDEEEGLVSGDDSEEDKEIVEDLHIDIYKPFSKPKERTEQLQSKSEERSSGRSKQKRRDSGSSGSESDKSDKGDDRESRRKHRRRTSDSSSHRRK